MDPLLTSEMMAQMPVLMMLMLTLMLTLMLMLGAAIMTVSIGSMRRMRTQACVGLKGCRQLAAVIICQQLKQRTTQQ
jgi:hypothetical protein